MALANVEHLADYERFSCLQAGFLIFFFDPKNSKGPSDAAECVLGAMIIISVRFGADGLETKRAANITPFDKWWL